MVICQGFNFITGLSQLPPYLSSEFRLTSLKFPLKIKIFTTRKDLRERLKVMNYIFLLLTFAQELKTCHRIISKLTSDFWSHCKIDHYLYLSLAKKRRRKKAFLPVNISATFIVLKLLSFCSWSVIISATRVPSVDDLLFVIIFILLKLTFIRERCKKKQGKKNYQVLLLPLHIHTPQ